MKAKMIKAYQAVYLDRKLVTHFPNKSNKDVELEVVAGVGVKVSSATDSIFVPFPNIAYVQLETEEKKESKPKAKTKAKD